MSREVSVFLKVTMASDLSATIYVSREVSVFLLLVMVMHPYRWSLKV